MSTNNSFDKILQDQLDERKANGLLRSLVSYNDKIDFSSNDYLGFAKLPQLKSSSELPSGATGSRLITGNPAIAEETEKLIANFHSTKAALIFNSGYCANVGLFSCIAQKGDTIITDEFIHASIIDGARLSNANRHKFKHNDIADLEKKLLQAQGKKIVAVESIYSMDGDEAPLKDIVALCKKYNAILIVDEAHAVGIFGEKGEGLVCTYHLQKDVYACIYTFGKALGLHGAVITGSETLRDYLINHARSFIYTTALPPHTYVQIQQAYQLLPTANRKALFALIDQYTTAIKKIKNISFIESHSAIQTIIIGENNKAKALANHLTGKGFFAKAILSPTVPAGTERLRICLHAFNTKEQIDLLLNEVEANLNK
ncbi:MAG TPA: pyridoxal phosphate-dependent aminotransferase family protein [Ferruginibacter sp.]|nr:pyridoxal phosphate-dependent aminotransferase family protein [Ferruginibacter sp.]